MHRAKHGTPAMNRSTALLLQNPNENRLIAVDAEGNMVM